MSLTRKSEIFDRNIGGKLELFVTFGLINVPFKQQYLGDHREQGKFLHKQNYSSQLLLQESTKEIFYKLGLKSEKRNWKQPLLWEQQLFLY